MALLTFTTLLFTGALCTSQPSSKDVDIISLKEHVKKMDASFQELKSHSQAQEQKYSAVLSSVLSQLTQTTEELSRSKNVSEEFQEELERMKEELESLREANNKTTEELEELKKMKETNTNTTKELQTMKEYTTTIDELAELKESHNQSLIELTMVKSEVASLQRDLQNMNGTMANQHSHGLSQLNSTQTEILVSLAEIVGEMNATGYIQLSGSRRPWLHKDFGFEASLGHVKTFLAFPASNIAFNIVNYNVGNGYNKTTGYFTAPVSGTYLFWTNIVFRSKNDTTFAFHIQMDDQIIGSAYGRANERFGTASATSIFFLREGQRTNIQCSKEVELQATVSSAGAVLIK